MGRRNSGGEGYRGRYLRSEDIGCVVREYIGGGFGRCFSIGGSE